MTGPASPRAELWIPAPTEWLNANQRLHWAAKAKRTRIWRQAACAHAKSHHLPTFGNRVHVTITITKPTRRRYDVHNLLPTAKAVIDGLVDYGLIPDDDNAHLIGPDLRAADETGPAAITITITEAP